MGQRRGFYQGRNPEFFLHKNIWEFYEFVPPVPIIMHLFDWQFDGRKCNLSKLVFIFCGTRLVSLSWLVHMSDQRLYQNQSTDHLCLLPWKYPFPHSGPLESPAICTSLCNPVWEIRNCVGPTLRLSHAWFPNSLFWKYYLYLRL